MIKLKHDLSEMQSILIHITTDGRIYTVANNMHSSFHNIILKYPIFYYVNGLT